MLDLKAIVWGMVWRLDFHVANNSIPSSITRVAQKPAH